MVHESGHAEGFALLDPDGHIVIATVSGHENVTKNTLGSWAKLEDAGYSLIRVSVIPLETK
ncbi:hypothetical protein DLP3_047 [Stenotrophomonas phage vB_SmaS_DLP_3]|nr:hypothetical protein DLP3_047 [Stenotrophomonas phage vB_SmaS_DLP_3]